MNCIFAGIGIVTLSFITSMAYDAPYQHRQLSFATVEKGNHIVHEKSGSYVFRDAASWKDHCITYKHTIPPVDFTKEMVLAAYSGASPSNAILEIKKITEKGDTLEVLVEKGVTPAGTIMAIPIYPYHLITTPNSEKKVVWIDAQRQSHPEDHLVP